MRKASTSLPVSTVAAALLAFACSANDPAPPRGSGGTQGTTDADVEAGSQAYPPGPYGVTKGSIIQDLTWQGWTNPPAVGFDENAFETISLRDYYDPDGTKGYKAIVLNAAARWCSICKIEQDDLRKNRDTWGPKGAVFLEALFEGVTGQPAQPSDLTAWGNTYQIDWILVLDPNNRLSAFFDPSSAPMNMIIDARTMEIRDIVTGLPDKSWWSSHLDSLTAQ